MLKDDIKNMFETNNGAWDNRIAFSPKDISIMLGLSLRKVLYLCQEGTLKSFKIGNTYRIKRQDLYQYIEDRIEDSIIL